MYFAPLSSPKPKHLKIKSKLDFLKLDNGKLGAINFNNMIPVSENNYNIIYFDKKALSEKDKKYEQLLRDQLNWLNENYIQVKNKSSKIYNLYINDKLSDNIKSHCCNYPLLEEKCMEYNKMVIVS